MQFRSLGESGLSVAPVVFGGNVLGWTIDGKTSFDVLDAFVDHGFNAIDTADVYSRWVPGHKGGESETILGRWLKARPGRRDDVVIFTKVGMEMPEIGGKGLTRKWIMQAVDASLARLGIASIDLYFSHLFDADVTQDETLGAYQELQAAGKIKAIGASNFNATQLAESLRVSHALKLPQYQVLQPEYNLVDRDNFEGELQQMCLRENIGVVPYYSLASGFLSGKYRTEADLGQSVRGSRVAGYLDERGLRILAALDSVSAAHGVKPAEVALAWLMAQPGCVIPIASATSIGHVESFARAASLKLSEEELSLLTEAGA